MQNPYTNLAVQTVVSGIVVYLVMFVMIDGLSSFYNSLNMLYMTLMMVAPMVVMMVIAMPHMFSTKAWNVVLVTGSVVVFLASFALIRTQIAIDDRSLLRSMIPHHSGAILMCREASLVQPDVITLCKGIIRSQRSEIEQMKRLLAANN